MHWMMPRVAPFGIIPVRQSVAFHRYCRMHRWSNILDDKTGFPRWGSATTTATRPTASCLLDGNSSCRAAAADHKHGMLRSYHNLPRCHRRFRDRGSSRWRARFRANTTITTAGSHPHPSGGGSDHVSSPLQSHEAKRGSKLRSLLEQLEEDRYDPATGLFEHASDVLRSSLREVRIVRARVERANRGSNQPEPIDRVYQQQQQQIIMISDCFRLLDRLLEALPRREDYSSSWLNGGVDDDDGRTMFLPSEEEGVLDKELLNELLKEWAMALRQRMLLSPSASSSSSSIRPKLLAGPSAVAEAVDRYRSIYLVQPDPTTFNLLLHAMIIGGGGGGGGGNRGRGNDRTRAVKLADDYLSRLLKAELQQVSPPLQPRRYLYVDVVSLTTVMKGWVSIGRPDKAQEWLDAMATTPDMVERDHDATTAGTMPTIHIEPNAVAYSTVIHGWARNGNAVRAEEVLRQALEDTTRRIRRGDTARDDETEDDGDGFEVATSFSSSTAAATVLDRVVFHALLNAWAVRAAAATGNCRRRGTHNNSDDDRENDKNTAGMVPAQRAKALVQTMHDLADQHPFFLEHLRPNEETWHKLIAVVASSRPTPPQRRQRQSQSSENNDEEEEEEEEVGPRAAERLLEEFETKQQDLHQQQDERSHRSSSSSSATPAVLLNRILKAYCSSGRTMDDAEAFYHRRCHNNDPTITTTAGSTDFPNDVTFLTILSGWATTARVAASASKTSKSKSRRTRTPVDVSAAAADIPLRAEAWLKTMQMQQHRHYRGYGPSPSVMMRASASVLQSWSLSTRHNHDAADRAEALLKRTVWPMLPDDDETDLSRSTRGVDHNHGDDVDLLKGIVINTNIVLRAWSNQAAAAAAAGQNINKNNDKGHAVRSCIRLLQDFLVLADDFNRRRQRDARCRGRGMRLAPSPDTFRPVLHAILTTPSMTVVQKHDRARSLLGSMTDRFHLRLTHEDLAKLERLAARRGAYLEKQRRRRNRRRENQDQSRKL